MLEVKQPVPTKERPRCRACGKRLKPNYITDYKSSEDSRKKKIYREWGETIREGDRGALQDSKGRWYVERPVREVASRSWRGTYSLGDLFCGPNCACNWALAVCPELEKKGSMWRCGEAIAREKGEGEGDGEEEDVEGDEKLAD